MAINTRWNTKRLDAKLTRALTMATGGYITQSLEANLRERVVEPIEGRIEASGRGGEHNKEFAHQDLRVFTSAAGRINISLGWINPPAHAREKGGGGNLWYQYQDAGFFLFGGNSWIEGVGATIDRRERTIEVVQDVCNDYVKALKLTLEA